MSARRGLHAGQSQWVADLSEPDGASSGGGVLALPSLGPALLRCEGSFGALREAEAVRSQGGAP